MKRRHRHWATRTLILGILILAGRYAYFSAAASSDQLGHLPPGAAADSTIAGQGRGVAGIPENNREPVFGSCTASGTGETAVPDPSCTPGSTSPIVGQANISGTICRTGWTRSVRPPVTYTEALKLTQMSEYGERGRPSAYEEDHLVPLELGGSPADPANLWPEPARSPNFKDKVEDAANRAVCQGRLSLSTAQREIAANWLSLGSELGVGQQ